MTKIIVDVSPSVDGFVAGDGVSVAEPFGDAGHRLHRWIGFDGGTPTEEDAAQASAMFDGVGAVVVGRTMFDVGIDTWGPDGAFERPTFVVTRRPGADLVRGRTTFTAVAGVPEAVAAARAAAGEQDVLVGGGADVVRQCLALGLVDELRLRIVPVVLGRGIPLFGPGLPQLELECLGTVTTPYAAHLTYRRAGS
jgi:dihydrofolate reductase